MRLSQCEDLAGNLPMFVKMTFEAKKVLTASNRNAKFLSNPVCVTRDKLSLKGESAMAKRKKGGKKKVARKKK